MDRNAFLNSFHPITTEEYEALQKRDLEMEKLIHEFKNSLLIEKIKMDTWENSKKSGK